ncbi:leptin [Nitzschia inconspicua]|uniref:Leptin n=1 Tax=Nitzschia inconspicua TaxID=303405 RepID=A0A9K3M7Y6_9STRA|nr:leptin [Nitzschia inconspicua]
MFQQLPLLCLLAFASVELTGAKSFIGDRIRQDKRFVVFNSRSLSGECCKLDSEKKTQNYLKSMMSQEKGQTKISSNTYISVPICVPQTRTFDSIGSPTDKSDDTPSSPETSPSCACSDANSPDAYSWKCGLDLYYCESKITSICSQSMTSDVILVPLNDDDCTAMQAVKLDSKCIATSTVPQPKDLSHKVCYPSMDPMVGIKFDGSCDECQSYVALTSASTSSSVATTEAPTDAPTATPTEMTQDAATSDSTASSIAATDAPTDAPPATPTEKPTDAATSASTTSSVAATDAPTNALQATPTENPTAAVTDPSTTIPEARSSCSCSDANSPDAYSWKCGLDLYYCAGKITSICSQSMTAGVTIVPLNDDECTAMQAVKLDNKCIATSTVPQPKDLSHKVCYPTLDPMVGIKFDGECDECQGYVDLLTTPTIPSPTGKPTDVSLTEKQTEGPTSATTETPNEMPSSTPTISPTVVPTTRPTLRGSYTVKPTVAPTTPETQSSCSCSDANSPDAYSWKCGLDLYYCESKITSICSQSMTSDVILVPLNDDDCTAMQAVKLDSKCIATSTVPQPKDLSHKVCYPSLDPMVGIKFDGSCDECQSYVALPNASTSSSVATNEAPTDAPTATPTEMTQDAPTSDSIASSIAATDAPTDAPPAAPTKKPTDAATSASTTSSVAATDAPINALQATPTENPTAAVTDPSTTIPEARISCSCSDANSPDAYSWKCGLDLYYCAGKITSICSQSMTADVTLVPLNDDECTAMQAVRLDNKCIATSTVTKPKDLSHKVCYPSLDPMVGVKFDGECDECQGFSDLPTTPSITSPTIKPSDGTNNAPPTSQAEKPTYETTESPTEEKPNTSNTSPTIAPTAWSILKEYFTFKPTVAPTIPETISSCACSDENSAVSYSWKCGLDLYYCASKITSICSQSMTAGVTLVPLNDDECTAMQAVKLDSKCIATSTVTRPKDLSHKVCYISLDPLVGIKFDGECDECQSYVALPGAASPSTIAATDAPTDASTAPPTEKPTVPPTDAPTAPPTNPPTVPPTDPLTTISESSPSCACSDENSAVSYSWKCGLDLYYCASKITSICSQSMTAGVTLVPLNDDECTAMQAVKLDSKCIATSTVTRPKDLSHKVCYISSDPLVGIKFDGECDECQSYVALPGAASPSTIAATDAPTDAPTAPPTEKPTVPPTDAPTAPPTNPPTVPPTDPLTTISESSPSCACSDENSAVSYSWKCGLDLYYCASKITSICSQSMTAGVTLVPLNDDECTAMQAVKLDSKCIATSTVTRPKDLSHKVCYISSDPLVGIKFDGECDECQSYVALPGAASPSTIAVTDAPTDAPTAPPTEKPTVPPTDAPTAPPTNPPTVPPTDPLTTISESSPSCACLDENSAVSYSWKCGLDLYYCASKITSICSQSMTAGVTLVPLNDDECTAMQAVKLDSKCIATSTVTRPKDLSHKVCYISSDPLVGIKFDGECDECQSYVALPGAASPSTIAATDAPTDAPTAPPTEKPTVPPTDAPTAPPTNPPTVPPTDPLTTISESSPSCACSDENSAVSYSWKCGLDLYYCASKITSICSQSMTAGVTLVPLNDDECTAMKAVKLDSKCIATSTVTRPKDLSHKVCYISSDPLVGIKFDGECDECQSYVALPGAASPSTIAATDAPTDAPTAPPTEKPTVPPTDAPTAPPTNPPTVPPTDPLTTISESSPSCACLDENSAVSYSWKCGLDLYYCASKITSICSQSMTAGVTLVPLNDDECTAMQAVKLDSKCIATSTVTRPKDLSHKVCYISLDPLVGIKFDGECDECQSYVALPGAASPSTIAATDAPTDASTAPPTEKPTVPPTDAPTAPPTNPPTVPPTDPLTTISESSPSCACSDENSAVSYSWKCGLDLYYCASKITSICSQSMTAGVTLVPLNDDECTAMQAVKLDSKCIATSTVTRPKDLSHKVCYISSDPLVGIKFDGECDECQSYVALPGAASPSTIAATDAPTDAPTAPPTEKPTVPPTDAPTAPPTNPPTVPPTDPLTTISESSPSCACSDENSAVSYSWKCGLDLYYCASKITSICSQSMTAGVTLVPLNDDECTAMQAVKLDSKCIATSTVTRPKDLSHKVCYISSDPLVGIKFDGECDECQSYVALPGAASPSTIAATDAPTDAPTAPPTEKPTVPPTDAPTAPPTNPPTVPPTDPLTTISESSPSCACSDENSAVSYSWKCGLDLYYCASKITSICSQSMTAGVTLVPLNDDECTAMQAVKLDSKCIATSTVTRPKDLSHKVCYISSDPLVGIKFDGECDECQSYVALPGAASPSTIAATDAPTDASTAPPTEKPTVPPTDAPTAPPTNPPTVPPTNPLTTISESSPSCACSDENSAVSYSWKCGLDLYYCASKITSICSQSMTAGVTLVPLNDDECTAMQAVKLDSKCIATSTVTRPKDLSHKVCYISLDPLVGIKFDGECDECQSYVALPGAASPSTIAATDAPTDAPTAPPTEKPTVPPTDAPTAPPTNPPTVPPTNPLTTISESSPSCACSDENSAVSYSWKCGLDLYYCASKITSICSQSMTAGVTLVPLNDDECTAMQAVKLDSKCIATSTVTRPKDLSHKVCYISSDPLVGIKFDGECDECQSYVALPGAASPSTIAVTDAPTDTPTAPTAPILPPIQIPQTSPSCACLDENSAVSYSWKCGLDLYYCTSKITSICSQSMTAGVTLVPLNDDECTAMQAVKLDSKCIATSKVTRPKDLSHKVCYPSLNPMIGFKFDGSCDRCTSFISLV